MSSSIVVPAHYEQVDIVNQKRLKGFMGFLIFTFFLVSVTLGMSIYICYSYTQYRNSTQGTSDSQSWAWAPLTVIVLSSVSLFLLIVEVALTRPGRYIMDKNAAQQMMIPQQQAAQPTIVNVSGVPQQPTPSITTPAGTFAGTGAATTAPYTTSTAFNPQARLSMSAPFSTQ